MLGGLRRALASRTEGNRREPWSGEFEDVATQDDILHCFRLLLGRRPHREEWVGHSSRAGEKLTGVVSSYLNSLEFQRRGLLELDHVGGFELIELERFKIYVDPADAAVGRDVVISNYELDVTQIFLQELESGMGVVDIGANIGYFTMLSASIVGPSGYVLAVEPNPRNTRLLEASRRANGFNHVTVAQVAAGPSSGLLALNTSHSNGTTSGLPDDLNAMMGAELVPSIPPDALVPADRHIALIKADVEGAEYLALQGCRNMIARHRPTIVSEFSPDMMEGISGVNGRTYLEWLIGQGYAIAVIQPNGSRLPAADPERVMDAYLSRGTDHIDLVATHRERT